MNYRPAINAPFQWFLGLFVTVALVGVARGQEAPKFVGVDPADGAENVPVTAALQFTFDMAMEPNPAVGGAPPFLLGGVAFEGVNAGMFSYEWSPDGKVLECTSLTQLPSNQTITWTLNPAGANPLFAVKSAAGIPLPTGLYTGSFQTGSSGAPDGCEPVISTRGSASFFKQARYRQVGNGDPALEPDQPFFGSVFASPPEGDTIESVTLGLPDGSSRPLLNVFGQFFDSQTFGTEAELNATFPAGNYQWSVVLGRRPEAYDFAMAVPTPFTSVPKITNLIEFEDADPARDFTLNWTPFAGAGLNDSIFLLISELGGEVEPAFQAPDPCVPRELMATDTSIVIPANTLTDGKRYEISLTFTHGFASSETQLPDSDVFGTTSVSTTMEIAKGDQPSPRQPLLEKLAYSNAGGFSGELHGVQGKTYRIEASVDLKNWEEVQRLPLIGTDFAAFLIPPSGLGTRYFHAALAEE